MNSGHRARGGGWLARAQRLVHGQGEPEDAEGFLLIPLGLGSLYGGDVDVALRAFAQLAEFARQFGDRDILCLAQLGQGQARIMGGRVEAGMALLDEAMVAVTSNEISPLPAGIVYCAVIGTCHLAYDLRRAHEWTTALDQWCATQPDMIPFSAQCQAHRSALYRIHGALAGGLQSRRSSPRSDTSAAIATRHTARSTRRARSSGCAASSRRRSSRTGVPGRPASSRIRASPSSRWHAGER